MTYGPRRSGVDQRSDRGQLRLAGVPVAIKDNLPVRGEPMRSGSAAAADVPQDEDHPVVARLRAADTVVVGMTNLPERTQPALTTETVTRTVREIESASATVLSLAFLMKRPTSKLYEPTEKSG